MQITIVQAEIEQAIRNYIQDQIMVKDGMQIDIDLKATRGDAGFMALIDIVPAKAVAATKAASAPKAPTPTPVKKEEPQPEPVSQGNEQPPVEGMTQTPASSESTSVATSTETPGQEAAAEPAAQQAATGEGELGAEPEAPKKTLFANIKRVSNN